MTVGIILAGGKGTRLKSKEKNKVALPFLNKPLIVYGVDLLNSVADTTIVVVGAFRESVMDVLKEKKVVFAYQRKRLGTGHAVKVGLELVRKLSITPSVVLVGYGDHTMFYTKETVKQLIKLHYKENAVISLITTQYDLPSELAWGRIIRSNEGNIVDSVEEKDATGDQKKITELNAGFYCFSYEFLRENIERVPLSSVSGEYYINSLIKIASSQDEKVAGLLVPFAGVGIGINRYSDLAENQRLYLEKR